MSKPREIPPQLRQPRVSKALSRLRNELRLNQADWRTFLKLARKGFSDWEHAQGVGIRPFGHGRFRCERAEVGDESIGVVALGQVSTEGLVKETPTPRAPRRAHSRAPCTAGPGFRRMIR